MTEQDDRADSPSIERHVAVEAPGADSITLLAAAAAIPRQLVKQAMQKGAVWLTRGRSCRRFRRVDRSLQAGDVLHLYLDPAVLAEVPAEPVLLADEHEFSVWFKPFGLRAQGSKWGDHCTVHRQVERRLVPQRPAFHVHRLDRAATGIVLIAHGKRAAAALAGMFEARAISKHYRVAVHGRFPDTPQPLTVDAPIDERAATSHVTLLQHDPRVDRSFLDVKIDTGRKHQIRRHLAGLGFPIVGDRRYGRGDDPEDLQLMAFSLAFQCPLTDRPRSYQVPDKIVSSIEGPTAP